MALILGKWWSNDFKPGLSPVCSQIAEAEADKIKKTYPLGKKKSC